MDGTGFKLVGAKIPETLRMAELLTFKCGKGRSDFSFCSYKYGHWSEHGDWGIN